jgi:hypothetical protein
MANDLDVIAVRIYRVGSIIVGVVALADTRRPVVFTTRGHSGFVERSNSVTIWSTKRDVCRRDVVTRPEPQVR